MKTTTRRKNTRAAANGEIPVRVSPRAPRKTEAAAPPPRVSNAQRAQKIAAALAEGIVAQVTDYLAHSPAVEKLLHAQTTRVLRALARDPQLTALIRAQADQYLTELAARPEILEPLVRAQVDHYLDHLLKDSVRLNALAEKINASDAPHPLKRETRAAKIKVDG